MNENFIITIGRQFGSGGREIGRQLSRLMNINYYDKELIQEAAKESGIDPHYFEKADETTPTGLYHAMLGFSSFNYEGALCNENIFKLQADVIQNIARKHSCVIVGRCADYILRENPRCISVFIHAAMNDRIARIQKNEFLSEKEAMEKAMKIDKRRAGYYNFYSDKEWGVSSSYDLSVNSSILGSEETARLIRDFVEKRLVLLDKYGSLLPPRQNTAVSPIITELTQINTLPRTESQPTVPNRYSERGAEQRALDMGGHIVVSFQGMGIIRCTFGHNAIHGRLEIGTYRRVGIFIDGKSRRSMLDKKIEQACIGQFAQLL